MTSRKKRASNIAQFALFRDSDKEPKIIIVKEASYTQRRKRKRVIEDLSGKGRISRQGLMFTISYERKITSETVDFRFQQNSTNCIPAVTAADKDQGECPDMIDFEVFYD